MTNDPGVGGEKIDQSEEIAQSVAESGVCETVIGAGASDKYSSVTMSSTRNCNK